MAQLQLPDCVHNWLVNFLDGHSHCTRFNGHTSDLLDVNASFVQDSAIGPGMYVVNAGDLQVVTPGNSLIKYADDTYLVICPATWTVVTKKFPMSTSGRWLITSR